ncbi:MAG: Alpha/beta hydrolase family protein [Syntrophaceae bacterium PtaU1.Bin231]|nr:MAG: Alpha/beta hydrolase family protein [Syntrophaceae bacterium PtaU1.Bin231]
MRMRLLCIWLLLIPCVAAQAADEEILAELHEQVVQVPVRVESLFGAKEVNLTATIYRPDGDGPFPLIVLSHGTPPHAADRVKIGRFRRIPQTREFIKRGFAVIVPIRRGHGATGGDYAEDKGKCAAPVYYEAGRSAGRDIVAAVEFAAKLPFVRPECVILVGQSAGGFGSLAAASMNPPGLIAMVNFSGGHGGDPATRPGEPCDPQSLRATFAKFSQTIKVPVLWHYAENDKFFSPKYVRDWFAAFEQAGGRGRLVMQPPFGEDGHGLFHSRNGIPIWTRAFDSFLGDFDVGGGKCGIRKRP